MIKHVSIIFLNWHNNFRQKKTTSAKIFRQIRRGGYQNTPFGVAFSFVYVKSIAMTNEKSESS